MNILITGGLGYIGTELCKLYENSDHKVVVLDKKFVPSSVRNLKKQDIKFFEGSITNEELVSKFLRDVDVVYHLAGITNVAYVSSEENEKLEREIVDVGINGTNNIINNMDKKTKLIFPSTHVVFEGYENTVFNLKESAEKKSKLAYSNVKNKNEEDIIRNVENYVILRLGSVYGFNKNMRINIMPNLFSKITSQNRTIKLFGGGRQHKSLVSVRDVARCMKFMAENQINKEIFHLSNENLTVKEVAEICNRIKPINIVETKDEVPNLGYTLDNSKLLFRGFKFENDIESEITNMIKRWDFY
ncbi:MAG: NAD(P)-dependent oxidoreductase [Nanoarchaeota archaeon]|nr:NAD(P)-dependent oxidoreductase [Nanoarchaeota archaeon]